MTTDEPQQIGQRALFWVTVSVAMALLALVVAPWRWKELPKLGLVDCETEATTCEYYACSSFSGGGRCKGKVCLKWSTELKLEAFMFACPDGWGPHR